MMTSHFEWTFNRYPVQKHPDSMMLATIEGGHLCRIEFGESNDQWAQRDSYDGCCGDAGISWLVGGDPFKPVDDKIMAWMEIVPAVSLVKD